MSNTRASKYLEKLEDRKLFTGEPWGTFPHLIGQDAAVHDFPYLNGAGQTVAIIDRGIDYMHPSLGGGIGPGFKVIGGYDFINDDNDPRTGRDTSIAPDPNDPSKGWIEPHGTGVAGIIAGNAFVNSGHLFQGIAPKANIIALRQTSSAQVKEALQWIIANRVKYNIVAVNLTDFIGSGHFPTVYKNECATLAQQGVFIATPSGNGGVDVPIENPGLDPNVFCTAAVDQTGQMWENDQRGDALDVLAPGVHVTIPYNAFDYKPIYTNAGDGTSWSTPHVTATALLLKQINSALTPWQIMSIIHDSGTPVVDPTSGDSYPMLNVDNAIRLAYQRLGLNPGPPGTTKETPFKATTLWRTQPATIQAENFDNGGQGVSYNDVDFGNRGGAYRITDVDVQDNDDKTGTYSVGWTQSGEWLRYTMKVAATGKYNISFRVASLGKGGKFHLEVDGTNKTGTMSVPDTKDWQKYTTITKSNVKLAAGKHIIRLVFDTDSAETGYIGNFNWIKFTQVVTKKKPVGN